MKEAKFLIFSFVVFLLAGVMSAHPVYAGNEYVGSYFTNSQYVTKAYLENDFTGSSPGMFPSNAWVGSVVNIVGTLRTGTNCPCFYQTAYELDGSGNVLVTAQYWSASGPSLYFSTTNNVGTQNSVGFDEEIRATTVAGGTIQSQGFVYPTISSWTSNTPTTYSFSYIGTGDTQFFAGTRYVCSTTTFPYQAGIESRFLGSSVYWYVDQFEEVVYNPTTSAWNYQPAASTEGNTSYYDCISGVLYLIGGNQWTGVNLNTASSGTDYPSWKYTGTTIGQGTSLWSGSGTATPHACSGSGVTC